MKEYVLSYSKLWVQSLDRRLGYQLDSSYYQAPFYIDEIRTTSPRDERRGCQPRCEKAPRSLGLPSRYGRCERLLPRRGRRVQYKESRRLSNRGYFGRRLSGRREDRRPGATDRLGARRTGRRNLPEIADRSRRHLCALHAEVPARSTASGNRSSSSPREIVVPRSSFFAMRNASPSSHD